MAEAQSLANHRRFVPGYHFFVLLVLLANTIWMIVDAFRDFSARGVFDVLVAAALFMAAVYARVFASKAQDRIIRNEERARLQNVLPADRQGDIEKFSIGQLVSMRFASDEELPALSATVLAGSTEPEAIKKAIKNWRADHDRL